MLGVKPCDEPAIRLRRIRNPSGRFMPRYRESFDRMGLLIVADATLIFNRLTLIRIYRGKSRSIIVFDLA